MLKPLNNGHMNYSCKEFEMPYNSLISTIIIYNRKHNGNVFSNISDGTSNICGKGRSLGAEHIDTIWGNSERFTLEPNCFFSHRDFLYTELGEKELWVIENTGKWKPAVVLKNTTNIISKSKWDWGMLQKNTHSMVGGIT